MNLEIDNDQHDEESVTRREFVQIMGGLGLSGAAAFGGWGLLESLKSDADVDIWRKSVCRFCGTGCGVQVGMKEGKVVNVRGDEEAHNKGVICAKGSMLVALPKLKGRLLTPKIRKGGQLVEASWEEAMALVSDKFRNTIKQHGSDAVAFYGSGQLYTEESYTANKLFKAGIGTNNVDGNPRLCMASAAVGYVQTFGKDEPMGSYEDIDHADCFFIIGANPYECHPPLFERIRRRQAVSPAAKVICVDPRKTLTAERSNLHISLKPGTDLLLLNAMMQVICEDDLLDHKFINEHVRFSTGTTTVDLEGFKKFLEDYRPEGVEARVGVSAEVIRRTAHMFARAKATTSFWTMGINQRTDGVFLNNALNSLHLITGQICRPGASPISLTGQCNACGGVRDTGSLAHLLPGGRLIKKKKHRNEMEALWKVPEGTISSNPGLDAINLFKAMEDDQVKMALIMCTNPAQSLPSSTRYKKAMDKAFLVVADIFEDTETSKYADVLLPAALWVEKEGVYGQTERRYQLIEKLIDAPGQARSDLDILVDLAERMGYQSLISAKTPEEVWDEWRKVSVQSKYNFNGITYKRLRKERGIQWPCPTETHPGTVRRYVGGDDPFVERGKKIEFYGHEDEKAVVFLRPYKETSEQTNSTYPYTLITGRVLEQWHTGTITNKVPELNSSSGPAFFEMNSQDALKHDVQDGSTIEIKSRYGQIKGLVVVSDRLRERTLFASFYDVKLLINSVVADNVDPISKEPEYKITAISIRKLKG